MAIALGKTVGEIERTMDSRELSEWLAYQQIEPLPDPYWIGAQIASVMANCWSKKQYRVEDFIPKPQAPPRRLTPEESSRWLKKAMNHG